MEIFVCRYSDKGGRKNNEDCVGILENAYVLADGLGGHSFGEIASAKTVNYILEKYSEVSDISDTAMHYIISDVNRYLWCEKEAEPSYENMASTVVAAFVKDGRFNYLNVGDSRLYYFRKNKIMLQSRDHSMTQVAVDMGEIKKSAMRFHGDRNKLTKVLGLSESLRINEHFEPFEICAGDAFLLCSDGFWEYIEEKQIQKTLRMSETPHKWLDAMLKIISGRVGANNDNLSAVCALVK